MDFATPSQSEPAAGTANARSPAKHGDGHAAQKQEQKKAKAEKAHAQ
jgi:hypothetical protein